MIVRFSYCESLPILLVFRLFSKELMLCDKGISLSYSVLILYYFNYFIPHGEGVFMKNDPEITH